jgi:hypothetical protein
MGATLPHYNLPKVRHNEFTVASQIVKVTYSFLCTSSPVGSRGLFELEPSEHGRDECDIMSCSGLTFLPGGRRIPNHAQTITHQEPGRGVHHLVQVTSPGNGWAEESGQSKPELPVVL